VTAPAKIARNVLYPLRRATQRWRALPNAIIIGAMKAGTTHLYNLLSRHPDVSVSLRKEVSFFDQRFGRGLGYYRAWFPLRSRCRSIVLEASPRYLMHPQCCERIALHLPRARLIALVRDPVKRAYSHFQHMVRRGSEKRTFAEALADERRLLQSDAPSLADYDNKYSRLRVHSYLTRGMYADQLARYFACFPREQIVVLPSEQLFTAPDESLALACRHLGIATIPAAEFGPSNSGGNYSRMDPQTEGDLRAFFAPHNRRLYDLLGVDLGWDGDSGVGRLA
jgi:hypothetical protein